MAMRYPTPAKSAQWVGGGGCILENSPLVRVQSADRLPLCHRVGMAPLWEKGSVVHYLSSNSIKVRPDCRPQVAAGTAVE